jgi:hypothetical protein
VCGAVNVAQRAHTLALATLDRWIWMPGSTFGESSLLSPPDSRVGVVCSGFG